jgi:hypothetical protein
MYMLFMASEKYRSPKSTGHFKSLAQKFGDRYFSLAINNIYIPNKIKMKAIRIMSSPQYLIYSVYVQSLSDYWTFARVDVFLWIFAALAIFIFCKIQPIIYIPNKIKMKAIRIMSSPQYLIYSVFFEFFLRLYAG